MLYIGRDYTKKLLVGHLALVQSFQDFSPHAEEMHRLREVYVNSGAFQEGRWAFLEKRLPVFQGQ